MSNCFLLKIYIIYCTNIKKTDLRKELRIFTVKCIYIYVGSMWFTKYLHDFYLLKIQRTKEQHTYVTNVLQRL